MGLLATVVVSVLGCSKELPPETNGSFTVSGGGCLAPCTVTFQAAQANARYEWSFPGGAPSTSAEANPTVRYNAGGSFKVTLIVVGEGGPKGSTDGVTVRSSTPTASFRIDKNQCQLPETGGCAFQFTNTATNGGASSDPNPTYTYPAAGVYAVTLKVSGPGGSTTSAPQSVTVIPFLVPPTSTKYLNLPFADLVSVPAGQVRTTRYVEVSGVYREEDITANVPAVQIGKYEVTQRQWLAVMGGNNPSGNNSCLDCPVENVFYQQIETFLTRLSAITGKTYRLPTKEEWEFAAGGGVLTPTLFGNGKNILDPSEANADIRTGKISQEEAAYSKVGNYVGRTVTVGSYIANSLGLYDMSGNVKEWTQSGYIRTDLLVSAVRGGYGIVKGGSYLSTPGICRIPGRFYEGKVNRFSQIEGLTAERSSDLGFRVVTTP
jgi:formylglycine-generating enzyme required for sulfatase activity